MERMGREWRVARGECGGDRSGAGVVRAHAAGSFGA